MNDRPLPVIAAAPQDPSATASRDAPLLASPFTAALLCSAVALGSGALLACAFAWLRLMSLPYSDFTPGGVHQRPLPVAGLELGPTVCYEVAYSGYMLHMLPEADALVNVTNDAWFGGSSARYQQFQMARMRALEEGRYMIVATNDGISAVIGPRGEIVASAPPFRPYVLRSFVEPMTGLTPYARVGNWLVVSLAIAGLVGALREGIVRRRSAGRGAR